MYDILIIGAGPAGLSAAIYAKRAGKTVLVLERKTPGGQLSTIDSIENYPPYPSVTGPALAMQFFECAVALGADIRFEDATEILYEPIKKVKTSNGNTYEGKAVILATGAEPKLLGLKDEGMLTGRGVSYCATCDGALYKGKPVAIIGKGAHVKEEAIFLSAHASRVYMLFEKSAPHLDIHEDNIEILENVKPLEFITENGILSGVHLMDADGTTKTLSVNGFFIALGNTPANRLCTKIPLTEKGYIPTDAEMQTSIDGVFAAGDIRDKKLRQIITAASDGATAAVSALRFIKNIKTEE